MNRYKFFTLIITVLFSFHFVNAQWKELPGPTGGIITNMDMDTNGVLYALVRDGGALYRSTNGGATWSNVSSTINFLHGFVVDGTTVYAHSWDGVYKRDNFTGTGTWTQINATTGMQSLDIGMSKIPSVNGLFIHGSQGGWISVDNGVNWKKIYDKTISSVAFSTAGDIYLAVPSVGIVKHPVQTGVLANWDQSKMQTARAKQFTADDVNVTVGVNRNNADKVFISYRNTAGSAMIYEVSTNGGTTWSAINSQNPFVSASRWFTFTGKFYHVVGREIFDVTDGAIPAFTKKGIPGFSFYNLLSIYYKNFNEIYAGIEGDGVWKSTDDAGTWAISNGTPALNADGVSTSAIMNMPARDIEAMGNRIMLIPHSDSYGYWTSTNEGANWSWVPTTFAIRTYYPHKVFERLQDNSIIVNAQSGTFRTTDGLVWNQQSTETFEDYVTVGATELFGFRGPGTVMKSTNNGQTWSTVNITGYPTNITNVQVAAYDGVNFYVAIIRAGQTQYWRINATTLVATQLNVAINNNQYSTSGMFVFKGKLYIGDYLKIAISNDQGNTFKYLDYQHSHLFPINQGLGGIGISRSGALVVTQDDGTTFNSTALPRVESAIVNVANYNGIFLAATVGSPALKYTFDPITKDSLVYNVARPYINFGWQKMDGPVGGGSGRRLFKSSTNQLFVDNWNAIHRFNSTTNSWEFLESAFVNNNHGMVHDGTNIYQMRWGDLYKSTNGGNTFSLVSNNQFNESNGNGQGIFKTSTGTVFVLSANGLYRSTNDGVAFTKVRSGRTYTSMAQAGTTLLTVSTDNTNMFVERSTDGGVNWSPAQTGLTFPAVANHWILASESTNTFVITTYNNIYRSTDGGLTWASIKSNMPEPNNWCCSTRLYISPIGDYYFAANVNPVRLYVSTDKGASWTRKNTNTNGTKFNDIQDMIWVGTRIYALSGYYEGVLFSDDGGATFSTFENNRGFNGFTNFEGGQLNISNGIIAAGQSQAISISKDAGATWTISKSDAGPKMLKKQNSIATVEIIGYGNGTPIKSTNNGETWTPVTNQYSYTPFLTYNGSQYIMIGQVGTCCGQNFYSSTDLINWNPIAVSGIPSYINGYTSLASLGSRIFATARDASFRPEVYIINNGVATRFTEDRNVVQAISRDNKVYLFSNSGYIFESENGTIWTRRAVPSGTNKLIFANNGYLFLSGENGILWVSRDSGKTWQNVSASNVKTLFGDIAIDPNTGIAYGTHPSSPLFKSAGIVIPNDNAGPTVSSLFPAHNAIDVSANGFKLTIVFNESPKKAAGKNLRIYKEPNTTTPIETISVANGVAVDNTITFTPTTALEDLATYYVVVDNGAFTDFYNNESLPIGGSDVWKFTMADATPPAVTFTTSNLEKGVNKELEATVTDNGGLAMTKTTIHYRSITSGNASSFTAANMAAVAGGTSTNSKFKVTALDGWYADGMGIEFYITAEDLAGKVTRSPSATDAYHYSYIKYPVASRPKVSTLTFGSDASAYRIISVPFKLDDPKIATVFDELGPANKKAWRMFTFAGDTRWNEFGDPGLSQLERGKGYWIIAKTSTEVFVEGAQSPENNRTSFFKMTLQPGWNQIGNPYPVAINWTETIAGKSNIGVIKKYTNGSYTNAEVLNPYEGGFVFVTGASQEITFRFPGITTGGRTGSGVTPDLASKHWELPINIEQGDISNALAGIGMNPTADLNFDQFDDLNMPAPEGLPKAELSFAKHAGSVKELAKDVVPTQSEYTWQFTFNTNSSERTSFKWDNESFGDNTKELFLMDEGTQQLVNMRSQSSYSFDPAVSKSFKIYFGDNLQSKILPGKVLLGVAYPNPATDQVSVPFTLSDLSPSYAVKLEVYNMHGSRVAVLYQGELTPGFYKQEWGIKDATIASGLYFVKMTVSGSAARETQIQKIIINR